MSGIFKYRVLVVDDDEAVLATTAAILSSKGYVVETARDGFEALAALRGSVPEILVSDLKMPNMSGFELLAVVRKRFPGIGVIARSGEFLPLSMPEGVLADRYLMKSKDSNFDLIEAVEKLVSEAPLRAQQAKPEYAATWVPRSATGYIVVTCPMCLRSFSVRRQEVAVGAVVEEICCHCGVPVHYRIDTTISSDGEPRTSAEQEQARVEASKGAADLMQQAIARDAERRRSG